MRLSNTWLMSLGQMLFMLHLDARVILQRPHHPISLSPIVEAQGWIVDVNGDIFLVAQLPNR